MGMFSTMAYGKFNFAEYAGSIAVLLVKPPFLRESAVNAGVARGAKTRTMPGSIDIHGAFISQQIELAEGSVIALQVARTRRGARQYDGTMFIRLRAQAAHIRIAMLMPPVTQRRFDAQTVFEGNADFMSVDDLADIGIVVSPQYGERFLDVNDIEQCFRLTEISPERQSRGVVQVVHTAEGDKTVRLATAPVRRMRIGKVR